MLSAIHAETPLKGLIVASPNNPNGTMVAPKDLYALVVCTEKLIRIFRVTDWAKLAR
jgi:histidinol-phosphate/aromatic aminotransferase/cobyric acid decarboxylase-like protein